MLAFGSKEGDLVLYSNLLKTWQSQPSGAARRRWSEAHAVRHATLERAARTRAELRRRLLAVAAEDGLSEADLLSCEQDIGALQRCVCAAFALNAALLAPDGASYRTVVGSGHTLRIHPTSILARFGGAPPACIVFPTPSSAVRHVTAVPASMLPRVAPHVFSVSESESQSGTVSRSPLPADGAGQRRPLLKRAKHVTAANDFLDNIRF